MITKRGDIKNRFSGISRQYGWIPPKSGYLIGWYKVDEESGSVVHNSALEGQLGGGLLPDLNIIRVNDWWTYTHGCGTNPHRDPPNNNLCYVSYPQRNLGGGAGQDLFAFGIFFYPLNINAELGLGVLAQISVDGGAYADFEYNISWSYTLQKLIVTDLRLVWGSWTGWLEQDIVSKWNFLCFYNVTATTHKIALIKWDGSIFLSNYEIGATTTPSNRLMLGSRYDDSFGCKSSFGDLIIYNNYKPTWSEWMIWYNLRRVRYGMLAPHWG